MYRKILLAFDGTPSGQAALNASAELARLCGARLCLLGIIATSGFNALAEGFGIDLWGMERRSLEATLKDAVAALEAQGIDAGFTIAEGDPAAEIHAQARRSGYDLLVLGHTGRGMIARWFEGSVSRSMLTRPPCSVLIVPG
ncbi:MAG: universal stress protein [Sphingomonadales bacterium]|nr:universal stress protein [Sphingomonadales bacterium]